jgi:hypothetical protein
MPVHTDGNTVPASLLLGGKGLGALGLPSLADMKDGAKTAVIVIVVIVALSVSISVHRHVQKYLKLSVNLNILTYTNRNTGCPHGVPDADADAVPMRFRRTGR